MREVGLYKEFVLFFDMNGDGSCAPDRDEGFQGATGGGTDPYDFSVEEWMIFPMDEESCGFIASSWMD